jgi:hypothetical protein
VSCALIKNKIKSKPRQEQEAEAEKPSQGAKKKEVHARALRAGRDYREVSVSV